MALNYLSENPTAQHSLFTLATKFDWTIETAQKESSLLNPEKLEEKVPAYASALKNRFGENNWKTVVTKTAQMMLLMGQNPDLTESKLMSLQSKIRLSVGDKDQMVSVRETEVIFKSLPYASLLVLPETKHPVEQINIQRIGFELISFFC